jgi:hypothetical protein
MEIPKITKVGLMADLNLCIIFDNNEEKYFRLTETRMWPNCLIEVTDTTITINETTFAHSFVYTRSEEYLNPFLVKRPFLIAAFDENGSIDPMYFFEEVEVYE